MKAPFRVLNTRPQLKAAGLTSLLDPNKFEIVEYCPIKIVPKTNLETTQTTRQIALDLDQFSDVIVTSGFAAELGLDFLENFWPQWPLLRWWAIGDTTSKIMNRFHIEAQTAHGDQNSETLLTMLRKTWADEYRNPHILIITGEQGRGYLEHRFEQANQQFQLLSVYQRIANPQILPAQQFDAIIVTSIEIAQGILKTDEYLKQFRANCHFVCASERIADFVRSKGVVKVINSRSAKNEIMSECVKQLLNND